MMQSCNQRAGGSFYEAEIGMDGEIKFTGRRARMEDWMEDTREESATRWRLNRHNYVIIPQALKPT